MTVCACLWLGLFPLLQFGTYSTITYDKWRIMLVLAGFSLLCAVFFNRTGKSQKSVRSYFRPPVVVALVLATWMILSCLVSPYGADQWMVGASVRREGLLTQLCYLGLFFMFASARVNRKAVAVTAAAGVIVFWFVVILQRSGFNAFGLYPEGRSYENAPDFQGTIGNIDMDTGYLFLVAGLLLGELTVRSRGIIRSVRVLRSSGKEAGRGKKRYSKRELRQVKEDAALDFIYAGFLLIAFTLAVYLIISMGTETGKFVLAILAVITLLQWIPRKWRLPVFLVLLVLVLVVVWYWPGQLGGVYELHEALHGRMKLSYGNNRIAVWVYSLGLAHNRLWTGSGSDTFILSFTEYLNELQPYGLKVPEYIDELYPLPPSFAEYLDDNRLAFLKPVFREYLEQAGQEVDPAALNKTLLPASFDTPHSEYVAHLVNHGLPGMLLFIALIVAAVFFRRKRKADTKTAASPEDRLRTLSPWAVAVLFYSVQGIFFFSVCLVAPMFWVVLGLCVRNDASVDAVA